MLMSTLSLKGGQAIVGLLQFAPTKPERAFDLPAIVTKTTASFSPKDLIISYTFSGFLCAEAA